MSKILLSFLVLLSCSISGAEIVVDSPLKRCLEEVSERVQAEGLTGANIHHFFGDIIVRKNTETGKVEVYQPNGFVETGSKSLSCSTSKSNNSYKFVADQIAKVDNFYQSGIERECGKIEQLKDAVKWAKSKASKSTKIIDAYRPREKTGTTK